MTVGDPSQPSTDLPPYVSIIIPTYNRGELLRRCLKSLVIQTFKNFEVLVCDDGSTDHTSQIVAEFSKVLNVTYHWDTNSGGPARPRNAGLRLAQGKYIVFLDSDDWWLPQKLAESIQVLERGADVVYHDLWIVPEQSASIQHWRKTQGRKLTKPVFVDLMVNAITIANSSVVIRRSVLAQIGFIDESPEIVASEDYDTWLRVARVTERFHYIPKILGYYSISGDNISAKDMSLSSGIVCMRYMSELDDQQKKQCAAMLAYIKGRYQFRQRDYANSRPNLVLALSHSNLQLKVKSAFMLAYGWLVQVGANNSLIW